MRLDLALVERGLVRSRNQAARLVADGLVKINSEIASKPSQIVQVSDKLTVAGKPYVARSAEKLSFALEQFKIEVPVNCLDIGASTGGFTQVLLERGAEKVVALDVGTDQLARELREDPRVIELSGVNVREFSADDLPLPAIGLVVVDLSFISLTLVAEKIATFSKDADFIFLIKPQFEVQKKDLNKHGVLVDQDQRLSALKRALVSLSSAGLQLLGLVQSPITGSTGNIEFLAHCKHGPAADLDGFLAQLG